MTNNKQRCLIKVTYLEGPHKGTSYLMRKKGYIADETGPYFPDITYASYGIALRECRYMEKSNALNRKIELQDRARKVEKGRDPGRRLFYAESYEPYPVDTYNIAL